MDPSNYLRSIQCTAGTVYLHADGYVVIDQVPGATQTWDSACEMLRAGALLVEPGTRAASVVLANQSKTDRDARRAFTELGEELVSCVALVVRSKVSEVTGNFFLRINKPPYPMQLFGNLEDASAWVTSYVGVPLGPGAAALLSDGAS